MEKKENGKMPHIQSQEDNKSTGQQVNKATGQQVNMSTRQQDNESTGSSADCAQRVDQLTCGPVTPRRPNVPEIRGTAPQKRYFNGL